MNIPFVKRFTVGIDISDQTIEVVVLKKDGSTISLVKSARTMLAPGVVLRGLIQDKTALLAVLQELLLKSNVRLSEIKTVVFGLPESQSYVHSFMALTAQKGRTYDVLIRKELSNVIPVSLDEITTAKLIVPIDREKVRIIATGANFHAVTTWRNFFASLGVKHVRIAPETAAMVVGLAITTVDAPCCVVDMGAFTTTLTMCNEGHIVATYSFARAGEFLTKGIMTKKGMSYEESEHEKQTGGLVHVDKDIAEALMLGVQKIAAEIKMFVTYVDKQKKIRSKKLILVGGTSLLPGISEALTKGTGIPVEMGGTPFVPEAEGVAYIEAAGLALAGLQNEEGGVPFFEEDDSKHAKEDGITRQGFTEKAETDDASEEDVEEDQKIKKQKRTLMIIASIGIVCIGLSFWYRANQEQKKQAELAARQANFAVVQAFEITIPIAIDGKEASSDRAEGRLFIDAFTMRAEKEEAMAFSKINASHELAKGENVWPIAMASSSSPGKKAITLDKKYGFTWLLYRDETVNALVRKKVQAALLASTVKFAINNIEKSVVKPSQNPSVYLMTVVVHLEF